MHRPTLDDVARMAGVTPTTVSRVINNRGSVSEKTKNKVNQAMESLNYQPNALARTLLGKQSFFIGLIFPTTANPFYSELMFYLEKIFSDKGYKVIICNTKNDIEKEKDFVRMLLANQVDGLIVGSHNIGIDIYQKTSLPIISIDRILSDKVTVLRSDNYHGGELAAKYLDGKHCKNVAHINSLKIEDAPYSYERRDGFVDYFLKKELSPQIFELDYELPFLIKKNIVEGILEQHTDLDGLFIADDLTAILAMNICKEMNRDIEIIGYDGSEEIINYFPSLPTIRQPIKEMAEKSVELLIKQITKKSRTVSEIVLPVKLIEKRK